jgi:pentapeptide MXKDX repeat protein
MRPVWQVLAVAVLSLGLGVAVTGCTSSTTPAKDKMGSDKMGGSKMTDDKMGGDKMDGDKMKGDKMKDGQR